MNIYVMKISDCTTENLNTAKKIDRNDIFLLVTGKDGTMPCSIYPALSALKTSPEFISLDEQAFSSTEFAFLLGVKCVGTPGTVYLIGENPELVSLDEKVFPVDEGEIKIYIVENIDEAFLIQKDKAKRSSITKKNPKTAASQSLQQQENMDDTDADADVPDEFPDNDTVNEYAPASSLLIDELENIGLSEQDIAEYADVLQACLRISEEGVLSGFEFQLEMRLGKEKAKYFLAVLEDHYDLLKAIVTSEM